MSKLFDIHCALWRLNSKFIKARNHDTCYQGVKQKRLVRSFMPDSKLCTAKSPSHDSFYLWFVVESCILPKALSKTKNPHLWQMWLPSSQVWLLNHPADMLARHNSIRTINTASNAQHQTNELCAPSICTNWMSAATHFLTFRSIHMQLLFSSWGVASNLKC